MSLIVKAAFAILVTALLVPRDCVVGQRIPGPDDSACHSTIGVTWPNPQVAYIVIGFLLAAAAGITALARVRERRGSDPQPNPKSGIR